MKKAESIRYGCDWASPIALHSSNNTDLPSQSLVQFSIYRLFLTVKVFLRDVKQIGEISRLVCIGIDQMIHFVPPFESFYGFFHDAILVDIR